MNWYSQRDKRIPKIKKVQNEHKLDILLFKSILNRQSPSRTEYQTGFRNWLQKWIKKNIPNTDSTIDAIGNMYITKGKSDIYPCIVAHLDTAQDIHNGLHIMELGNIIFGFDISTGEQCGVGFDDKNGIYIALECLKQFDRVKCFFPVDEEIGCIGSSQCNTLFFSDCSFLAQPDRRSYTTDFINFTNGIEVCNKDFYGLILEEMTKYGYNPNSGSCTDIGTIKKNSAVNIPAFNFSCGYIDEHTNSEITIKSGLENAMNFLFEVIQKVGYQKHIHNIPQKPLSRIDEITVSRYNHRFTEEFQEIPNNSNRSISYECQHYDFKSYDDKKYMEEMLELGHCPCCNDTLEGVTEDHEFYYYCNSCDSKWDIVDILAEMEEEQNL